MKTWLVIDVSYLCHRAFHTTKDLSWKGKATGVVFGFLKSISALKDDFQTDNIAFCFEHPYLFRREVFPAYKKKRHTRELSPDETKAMEGLSIQIHELRKRYLPRIGFKNVFCYRGFESDDIMAAIAYSTRDEVILVTADQDLYQCLRENVSLFSPQTRKMMTYAKFFKTYGISPARWAVMKAIAGCKTDEVPGIKGIGELTALKYLTGIAGDHIYKKITSDEACEIVNRNRRLVKLPYEGCPIPELKDDRIDPEGWREVCEMLGMKSIAGHPPISVRRGSYQ